MRKLCAVVVAAVLLLLSLTLAACGGSVKYEVTSTSTTTVQIPGEPNVEGWWGHFKEWGPSHAHGREWKSTIEEEFVTLGAHETILPNGSGSRFIEGKKGISLKLDPKAKLIAAETFYSGIDQFGEKWDGKGTLPFSKPFKARSGKLYHVRLEGVVIWISDLDAHELTGNNGQQNEQTS